MKRKSPRKVVRTDRFQREVARHFKKVRRGEEALEGFEEVVARVPELGMTAPGASNASCRPLHTESGSFLIVYLYDDAEVVLLSIRPVPSGVF